VKASAEIFIALGSNLGDRCKNLARAIAAMSEHIEISRRSDIYETPPWGIADQPRFLNQVIQGTTSLTPHQLLNFLKKIEKKLGRVRTVRNGPRVIDLDILLYGKLILDSKRLQIPHPRMHERAFVLVPLADLAPGLIIPGQILTIHQLLQPLTQDGILRVEAENR
jgi:2-amino-4-hydroxy-6-hydroxymethyldihydropteridine diphosphokinase